MASLSTSASPGHTAASPGHTAASPGHTAGSLPGHTAGSRDRRTASSALERTAASRRGRGTPVLTVFALAVVALHGGCAGDDDDFDAPTCSPGEVAIEGTIDGAEESARMPGASSYIFVNAINGQLGTLTVAFGAEDMLYLEWPELVANGGSVDARGTIAFAGLAYGNCEDDGFPGTLRMNADGDGGSFRLRSLHPGADCSAAQASGELTGCFASSSP